MAAPTRSDGRRALLLIDFQDDFLADDGRMPVARHQVEPALVAVRAAVGQAQSRGDLIVQVGNEFRRRDVVRNLLRRHAAVAGGRGTHWDQRFAVPGVPCLPKWRPDAFCNPQLERLLSDEHVSEVVLAGLFASACVSATAKGAQQRGFHTRVLVDAVACRSDASRGAALDRLGARGVGLVRDYPAVDAPTAPGTTF